MNNTDITEFENQSGVGTAGLTGFVQGANKRYLPFQNGTSETKMITIPCQDQDIVTIKLLYFDTQGIICDGVFNLFINGSYLNFTGLSRGRESTLYYTYDSNNEVFRILIPQSSYAYCSARKASVDKTGVINNLSISDVFVENYNLAHWTELHINTAENTQYNNLTVIIDENDQEAIYDPHGILPTTIEKIKEAYHAEVADYCEVSNHFNENKTIQFFITGTDRLIGTLDTDFTSGEDNAGEVYLTLPAYSTWHYGTEVTENGTYVMNIPRGDYYLNTDTGDVYISLGNGLDIHGATTTSFDKIGSFRGPRGYAVNNIVLNNENESDPTAFITTSGDYNFYDMYVGEEGDSPEDSTYVGTFKVRNGVKGEQGDQGPRGAQGHPVFFTTTAPINITGADVGDYVVYTGTDDTFANIGDVFRLNSIDELTSTQIWQNTGGNIRGPKGDLLNAEGLIPAFRLINITDEDYPPMSYQKLQMSFDSFQTIIELGDLRCRSIRTIYQVAGLPDEEDYYTFRIEYTDGTNYDLKIQGSGGKGAYEAGRLINIDDDNKIHCEVPTVKHELIYSDENDELTTHQLLYQDALIVDNQQDFLQCKSPDNIETDVLASWQQFQAACHNNSYGNNMPEYGDGTYVSNSGYGYSRWYNDGGAVKNKVNSIEFNGYLMPYSKSSYIVESLIGTTSGNTTGDQIGFSIVNDSNAVARHFSTNKDVYYRNTLYDIYPSGSTGENSPKMPSEFAWVSVNQNNNTAKVIYWTGRVSSQGAESFPSGTVNVYSITNIKTSTGRHNRVLIGTETVTANSSVEASGYIGFINGVVTNSSSMSIAQLSDSSESYTGTIYIFGSVYDISTKKWYNSKIIDGNFSQKDAGNYWDKGYWLAPYLSELDTNSSGNAAVMKNLVSFDNGILTLKFGTASSTIEGADYNGSELKIDFKSKTYDFTPYSSSGKNPVTNIALPALPDYTTGSGVYDRNGNSVTPDLWSMFAGESKFMYNAFSYQNLYINCLKIIIDNLIFYVDKTSTDYGVWQLNNARTDYEKVYMTGGEADDPMSHFNGSRQSYNPITGKLFYNDGSKIYQIASDSKYTSGDNVAIDSNNAISALGYTLSGDNFYLKNVGGYNGGTVTSSHLSIQDVIGHVGRYTTTLSQASPMNGNYEVYITTGSTVYVGQPSNTGKVTTCSVVISNTSGSAVTPTFYTVGGVTAKLMTNIEPIPDGSVAEYVGTYIPTIGWLINGGTQRSVVSAAS